MIRPGRAASKNFPARATDQKAPVDSCSHARATAHTPTKRRDTPFGKRTQRGFSFSAGGAVKSTRSASARHSAVRAAYGSAGAGSAGFRACPLVELRMIDTPSLPPPLLRFNICKRSVLSPRATDTVRHLLRRHPSAVSQRARTMCPRASRLLRPVRLVFRAMLAAIHNPGST